MRKRLIVPLWLISLAAFLGKLKALGFFDGH